MAPSEKAQLLRDHLGLLGDNRASSTKWERLLAFIEVAIKDFMHTSANAVQAKYQTMELHRAIEHVVTTYQPDTTFPTRRRIADSKMLEQYIVHRVNELRSTNQKKLKHAIRKLEAESRASRRRDRGRRYNEGSDGDEDDEDPPPARSRTSKKGLPQGYIDLVEDSDDPTYVSIKAQKRLSTAQSAVVSPIHRGRESDRESPDRDQTMLPEPAPLEELEDQPESRPAFGAPSPASSTLPTSPENVAIDGDAMDVDDTPINQRVTEPVPDRFSGPSSRFKPTVVHVRRLKTNSATVPQATVQASPRPEPAPLAPPARSSLEHEEPQVADEARQASFQTVVEPEPLPEPMAEHEPEQEEAQTPPLPPPIDDLYIFLSTICKPSLSHLYSHLASHGYTMTHLIVMSEWDRLAIRGFFLGVQENVERVGDSSVLPIHWDVLEHYIRQLRLMVGAGGVTVM